MPFSFLGSDGEIPKDEGNLVEKGGEGNLKADFSGIKLLTLDDNGEQVSPPKKHVYSSDIKSAIESFPHILNSILLFWGSPNDFGEYIEKLYKVEQDRSHRQGFPREVMSELNMLHHVHDDVFGKGSKKLEQVDPWTINNKIK